MSFSPAVRRRELAYILRAYRGGRDSTKVSRELGWDPSKISRIESGRFKRINPRDVLDMLTAYGVEDAHERDVIKQIAVDSRAKGWWDQYGDVFRSELPDLEAGATYVQAFEVLVVPGLLQTPDYAAAVLRGIGVRDEEELARRVAARVIRQDILLRENPPRLRVILDEAVFAKPVGGHEVMGEQIRQLIHLATWPNVEIRMIPNAVGAHAGMCGQFTILGFDGHPSIAFLETPVGHTLVEKPDEVDQYQGVYDMLMAMSLPPEETLTAMAGMAGNA
ncbi:helix-turn-helix domain-containing protein [Microbispora sp. RL4-1S]|uniref:Helix-turn-helix domain-containing protein n=1 Tax=Microbispora oryzae TaxID=2806554 RepID=A0A940WP77_9ACTN|nr:helix-turn-helix transcriptional regulator [Microbispora oryzae]MBP2704349.1 helix-turn-helix domain-containing protein [Microbispora oryzae]